MSESRGSAAIWSWALNLLVDRVPSRIRLCGLARPTPGVFALGEGSSGGRTGHFAGSEDRQDSPRNGPLSEIGPGRPEPTKSWKTGSRLGSALIASRKGVLQFPASQSRSSGLPEGEGADSRRVLGFEAGPGPARGKSPSLSPNLLTEPAEDLSQGLIVVVESDHRGLGEQGSFNFRDQRGCPGSGSPDP